MCIVDFLMLLRSGGKLCGWLGRALWEYCISKDDCEENRSLFFLFSLFFLLYMHVCVCLIFMWVFNQYGMKAVSVQLLAHGFVVLV